MIRKGLCITIAVIMIVSMAACGAPVSPETASIAASGDSSAVVVFADPVLEARVRAAMGKPDGDITLEEAAAVTELNLSTDFTPEEPAEGTVIKDLSGLENFKNLEVLELHFHAVSDISPLSGLDKLRSLGLGGNPVADLSPLTGMTTITSMTLFNCQAMDYSPLATLTNLNSLWLEYSTIVDLTPLSGLTNLERLTLGGTQVSDVSPLAGLTNLKVLSLADCPITDYSPLADIYPNLEEKDFTMAFSLAELGFTMDATNLASYYAENLSVKINHSEWGATPAGYEMEVNAVHMYMELDGGYYLIMGYYPDSGTYVFAMNYDDNKSITYFYDPATGKITFRNGDRDSTEPVLQEALGDTDSEDILLAPLSLYNDTLMATFGMDADVLYALPFEPPTLLNLGFTADEANAYCEYIQKDETQEVETYYSVCVHRPEWGEQEYDVRFFTPVNGYGIVIYYFVDEQRFFVSADNQDDGSFAYFEFFVKDHSIIDGQSPEGMTVEEFFQNVYNDPEIEDVYLYSVQLMEQYIYDTFGMSIGELYALPVGE